MAYDHSHSADCHEELSVKYTEYIQSHLDALRLKCQHINNCIDTLLENENMLSVIGGYDLSLNKTCSLVYKSGYGTFGNFSAKCTSKDREDIRDDIETHLKHQITVPEWRNVKKCLDNRYIGTVRSSYVDEICGLAHAKPQICSNTSSLAHRRMEVFFNDQLQHLKCTCRALNINDDNKVSLPIVIAAVVGVVLLLLALFAIGFICYRRQRSKKRKNQAPSVIYMQAPNSDNCPVYQEVFDDRAYKDYRQSPSINPPNLPARYTTTNTSRTTHLAEPEDDQGYLEPAAVSVMLKPRLPIPGTTNPNYGAPPRYRDTADERNDDNAYFEPLPSPVEDEDKGYDTLGRNKPSLERSASNDKIATGPVPAKRIKKDDVGKEDHQLEPPYFLLEKEASKKRESDNKQENSVV